MGIAENLAKLMAAHDGMSANALARATGVPQPTISRILGGKSRNPEFNTLEPLARYFGLTVDRLVNGPLRLTNAHPPAAGEERADYGASPMSEDERNLLQLYRQLDEQKRRAWREVGTALAPNSSGITDEDIA